MSPEMRRRTYLKAMGITVWTRRDRAPTDVETPRAIVLERVEEHVPEPVPRVIAPPMEDGAIAEMAWEDLETAVRDCSRCELHSSRTRGVLGVGDRAARWLLVGEAPGADEDRLGQPFVGRAGELLDEMLRAVGLAREQVFIANILKSRPPNNRDPRTEEVKACMPYLKRQIALIQPAIIVAIGRIAAQQLLATDQPVGRLRGVVHSYGEEALPLIATYHPAYLLRKPEEKSKVWDDLRFARATASTVLR